MQRNAIIGLVVLVLIVLCVWYWSSSGAPTTQGPEAATQSATTTSSGTGTGSGSTTLRALASQSGNFTCSLILASSSGQTTGVIYSAGGKARLDFTVPSVNGSIRTHVIRSGGYSYAWVDGQTTGTKTAVSSGSSAATPSQGGFVSDDSTVSSECHPWSPDTSQFTLPKGITFVAR